MITRSNAWEPSYGKPLFVRLATTGGERDAADDGGDGEAQAGTEDTAPVVDADTTRWLVRRVLFVTVCMRWMQYCVSVCL